ncbi:MAG: threonyl-tRNA synthetase editing domain-containing protein [Desulfobulbaceae bacterium]|nr:threonyl-tRNA synthetase editing domain-containing protein [Desulfobulbaceae bacterium]
MKMLLFYTKRFYFKTASKGLPDLPELDREEDVGNALVVFFHVEAEDEAREAKVIRKFVKNSKWLARKFETKNIVLHSFNHLSLSKGSPELAEKILKEVIKRLERTDFAVSHTPFGYFNEFIMHVAGDSLAKVYKEF